MAEQYMSLADSESPEDLTAYQGLEPGWYTDPADPTTARYWDGSALGEERHPIAASEDSDDAASDDAPQLQHEGVALEAVAPDAPVELEIVRAQDAEPEVLEPAAQITADVDATADVADVDATADVVDEAESHDVSAHDSSNESAIEDREGVCIKCEQPGRYYSNADWCEEIRDSEGALVLMGSKYSDDMTCLECETELDSHHTERWIEVWAQKPRALATRKKAMSQSMQSSSAGK